MIYDLVAGQKTLIEDVTKGLNAEIASVDTLKGTTTPQIGLFNFWDYEFPTSFVAWPAFQLIWESGENWEPRSQIKWRADQKFEWQYWTSSQYVTTGSLQEHISITVHAMRRVVEKIPDEITSAEEVMDINIGVTGWREGDYQYIMVSMGFTIVERDESP